MNTGQILQTNIVKSLGLDGLPPEKQEKALLKIGEIVFQRVMIRAVEELNEKDRVEFYTVLNAKTVSQEAVLDFLRIHLPNFDTLLSEEIGGFKKEAVEVMKGAIAS